MLKLYRSRWKGESGAGGCNGAVLVEGDRPESGSASLPPANVVATAQCLATYFNCTLQVTKTS